MTNIMLPYGAGSATPEKSDATGQGGVRGQGTADSLNCAEDRAGRIDEAHRKRVDTLAARAALLGLVLQELHDGACILVGEARMPSLQAAEALVWGVGLVRAEMAAMAARLVPSKRLQP